MLSQELDVIFLKSLISLAQDIHESILIVLIIGKHNKTEHYTDTLFLLFHIYFLNSILTFGYLYIFLFSFLGCAHPMGNYKNHSFRQQDKNLVVIKFINFRLKTLKTNKSVYQTRRRRAT